MNKKNFKILFISRAYPPVIGGIENQNYGIGKALSQIAEVRIIANRRGKKFLPFFILSAYFQSLFSLWKYDVVLFGDGVLSPLGPLLKLFHPKKRFFSIIHGLDITYAQKNTFLGKIYRKINIPSLKKLDKLIMVGNHTISEAEKAGIPKEKCFFIPNGFDLYSIYEKHSRKELEDLLNIRLEGKKVMLRVGRFVRHKGLLWFIKNVMPKLSSDYVLIAAGGRVARKTAGDSDIYPECEKVIKELGLENRVFLFANMPQEKMNVLFNAVDIFISPNIKVPGSMEGFGINAIEGAACRKVVVASRLEGLRDAIYDGKNGFLVDPEDADKWKRKIEAIMEADDFRSAFGERAQKFTIENFSWQKIALKYLDLLEKEA
ncbi:MAG: glycosyltransferase family 4 protein [Candidatus Moranbacteria bacterium]|jgi:phosphatidylinositol alpha-1,6-mannosyltransferase|nr:glycosyltransferase family 4 protein [Candidatus Moranbacteria bacterium]MDD5652064.1 glycosyltransferase family 4 protein [Candidatus Moranbacteria bacterium]MDX9855771.1 glycosyltransferase family 4 protein [Candidatus Moranbacteria bacterium]